MDEIEAMKVISERFEKLSEDEQARVLSWVVSKYGGGATFKGAAGAPHEHAGHHTPAAGTTKGATAKQPPAPKVKGTKKAKTIISMDKSLNLAPSGKKSAVDFAAEKAPANVKQKCVVAVYYLRDFIEVPNVTTSAVYTFFKTLGWPVPADLKNTLQQAGTEGWLDTADGEDVKLTSMGENLVEHSLPPKAKA